MALQLNARSKLLCGDKAQLFIVDPDGEIEQTIPLPSGIVHAAPYIALLPEDRQFMLGENVTIVPARQGVHVVTHHMRHESGANPDFKPTSASRLERELRVAMSKFTSATSRIEAMERAAAKVERIPRAPASEAASEPKAKDEAPVVE